MHFVRLRLNGFKSFVDPAELQIREGLTGIVGPNGCGKSNLLEAIRWVMGENRPTAMRGDGMEDVIFSGSGRRPARAAAEVVLALDNSARTAPAGFNDADALDVSRKITRDLGSSYRINGREVRARDVQILFADAATGAASPGLVRQGQISDLINARPRARRRVLEDASGIGGLHQRRHEAELKLNATEANLGRVADQVEALAAQLAVLTRQARQAARYRELSGLLRRAEGLMLLARWAEAGAALRAAEARLAEALRTAGAEARAAAAAEAARAQAEGALPAARDEAAIAAAVVARTEAEATALADERRRAEAAVTDLAAQLGRAEADAAREAALAQDAGATLARLTAEAERIAQTAAGDADRLAQAEAAAAEAAQALTALEARQAAAAEAAALAAAQRQSLEAALAQARTDAARLTAAADRARVARIEAEGQATRADAALAAARTAADQAAAALAQAEAALAQAEADRPAAQTAEAAARAAAAAAAAEAGALAAEGQALERALSRPDPAGGGILAQLRVAPGAERALAAALADAARLPAAGTGPGWRALPPLAPPEWPAGVAPLAPQVSGPPELARRLARVGLAPPDLAARLQPGLAPGQQLVDPAGTVWRWDGAVLPPGSAAEAAALRLEQRNRLAALADQRRLAEDRARATAQALAAAAAALQRLTEAERTAREARKGAERRAAEAAQAAGRAEAARDAAAARLAAADDGLARAEAEAASAAGRLAEAAGALDDGAALAAARAALAQAAAALTEARGAAARAASARDAARAQAAARSRRQAEIAREAEAWRRRAAEAGTRIAEVDGRAATLRAALAEARAVPARVQARAASLSDLLARARARQAEAACALDAAEAAWRAAQEAERAAERALAAAREGRAAAEARVEAAREGVGAAAARILDERGQTAEDLAAACGPAADSPPPPAELDAEVARLRRARDALGAVNLRADEDARLAQAENDTLVAEKADLEAAVAKLRGAIGALNREGRERLLAAFTQVNTRFAQLFTHLFGGGEARLVLVESDDPLDAGLEILAQPPGKKLSSLGLLSGGEQTLTALALIFAVFLTNPAPICVLDEVDAPLDDANVARFCDLLDEMVRRTTTRFLVITHNPVTMARMDRLYGVTMVEAGVSQLVSVDLRRAEALVA